MASMLAVPDPDAKATAAALLAWYDRHRRLLPWRAPPGTVADPYAVWLSEIMLQQTTVSAVKPYFAAFLARWPTVAALAAAPLADVLAAWAGLGYYSRARNLHACAIRVARAQGGTFPQDEQALRALPGIGDYTAAAIAAIAFNRPATVVDGNVERVVARLFAVEDPLPRARPRLRALAGTLTPRTRPGDYAQAMMDLGAMVCRPRGPDCANCPLSGECLAHQRGLAENLPKKTPKPERPSRRGAVFVLQQRNGAILAGPRPPQGLLGGMLGLPGSEWTPEAALSARPECAPAAAAWQNAGAITHVFTHFRLELTVFAASCDTAPGVAEGLGWHPPAVLRAALPTVMKKALDRGLAALSV